MIKNLNQMPKAVIEKARSLPMPDAYLYIRRLLSDSARRYCKNFFEEVVQKGQDVATWRLGKIILPSSNDLTMQKMISHGVLSVFETFQIRHDEKWVYSPIKRERWQYYQFSHGAPAIIRPDLDYQWRPPDHVTIMSLKMKDEFVAVKTPRVVMRRWLASVIARRALQRGILTQTIGLDLVTQLYPDVSQLSEDAEIALNALFAELPSFEGHEKAVPGFIGPDSWYSGNLSVEQ